MCINVRVYIYIYYTYRHAHMYIYIYIYTHTYTYTYVCSDHSLLCCFATGGYRDMEVNAPKHYEGIVTRRPPKGDPEKGVTFRVT